MLMAKRQTKAVRTVVGCGRSSHLLTHLPPHRSHEALNLGLATTYAPGHIRQGELPFLVAAENNNRASIHCEGCTIQFIATKVFNTAAR